MLTISGFGGVFIAGDSEEYPQFAGFYHTSTGDVMLIYYYFIKMPTDIVSSIK